MEGKPDTHDIVQASDANKALYVGTFLERSSAAKAHDVAALRLSRETPRAATAAAAAQSEDLNLDLNFPREHYQQVSCSADLMRAVRAEEGLKLSSADLTQIIPATALWRDDAVTQLCEQIESKFVCSWVDCCASCAPALLDGAWHVVILSMMSCGACICSGCDLAWRAGH